MNSSAQSDLLQTLQTTLYDDIPLTNAMGLTVLSYDGTSLVLQAPLAPNINHKNTAFAGSLNAVLTLTGWGLLWLLLKELDLAGKIVIQDSTVNYLLPVTQDFSSTCLKPAPDQLARFEKTLRQHHRARLELEVNLIEQERLAVSLKGRYVAYLL
jgi:thioesterase domain-containing protein